MALQVDIGASLLIFGCFYKCKKWITII
jgi:hypothetical protein